MKFKTKNKTKKNIFLILFILILILVGICFFNINSNYVMKVNKEKISKAEFETYLFEQKKSFEDKGDKDIWETDFNGISAKEVAKQNAVNSILLVKAAVINASKLGVTLSEEELKEVEKEANDLYKEIKSTTNIELDLKTAIKIAKENKIEQKVFDNLTNNFELSEKDFNLYFNNYIEQNKKEIKKTTGNIAFIPKSEKNSLEITKEIYDLFNNNGVISNLKSKYPGVSIIENVELNNLTFEENVEESIYNLKENEISPIIEINSGYYIFKILKIELKDLNMLKEEIKKEYILNKKVEIYNTQYENWAKDITITKNEKIWDLISVKNIEISN